MQAAFLDSAGCYLRNRASPNRVARDVAVRLRLKMESSVQREQSFFICARPRPPTPLLFEITAAEASGPDWPVTLILPYTCGKFLVQVTCFHTLTKSEKANHFVFNTYAFQGRRGARLLAFVEP